MRCASLALVLALVVTTRGQVGPTGSVPPGPRTGMIVGQVIDRATGQPASEAIVTLTMAKYDANLPTTPKARVMTDGDGRFFFSELPAGDYYLESTKDGCARGSFGQRRPSSSGRPVTLAEGQRRTDVELPVWKYAVIGGTVVELQALSFMLQPPAAGGQLQTFGGHGKVDAEARFSFPSVEPDTYRFAHTWNVSSAREKWAIKSSTANGREAYETPLRVNAGEPVEWTVTFTDTPTTLTGLFQDPSGRAATEYYILAFSSDRKHWTPGSRRVRMTRPATDGAFTFRGLVPGEYFLVALPDLENGEWNDPTLLEQLAKSSATVTVQDGQTTTKNYRIGGG